MNTSTELDGFFAGHHESREIFDALAEAVISIGPSTIRVTRSQVAFWRDHPFAWAWMPEQYLKRKSAPLVLTFGLRRRDRSPRWKEIVEPSPGRFTHHLELTSAAEIDEEVSEWLKEAWALA